MNIVVRTANGNIIVRPDTTWEKDNEDLYLPDDVETLTYTPIMFVRVSRPGRSVGIKFVKRYYDYVNFGILLYPENYIQVGEEGFACASCLDHTSFLPSPLYNPITIGVPGNQFVIYGEKDSKEKLFSFEPSGLEEIENAFVQASKHVYLRTGDMVAIELAERKLLMRKEDKKMNISGTWCNNPLLDFNIII